MFAYFSIATVSISELCPTQDHASGNVLIHEAGGLVTDSLGRPLDFGKGRTLGENFGIVAAGADVHASVIAAIKKVKEEQGEGKL